MTVLYSTEERTRLKNECLTRHGVASVVTKSAEHVHSFFITVQLASFSCLLPAVDSNIHSYVSDGMVW